MGERPELLNLLDKTKITEPHPPAKLYATAVPRELPAEDRKTEHRRRAGDLAENSQEIVEEKFQYRLAELKLRAAEAFAANDLPALLALGRIAPLMIHQADWFEAETWQLGVKITCLFPHDFATADVALISEGSREELVEALASLISFSPDPHTLPEFELFLRTRKEDIEGLLDSVKQLTKACLAQTKMSWLQELRTKAMLLLDISDCLIDADTKALVSRGALSDSFSQRDRARDHLVSLVISVFEAVSVRVGLEKAEQLWVASLVTLFQDRRLAK
jgi:hypothetical protein